MRQILISLTATTLIALTGCASEHTASSSPPQPAAASAGPVINGEAQAALSSAQAAVTDAAAHYALWTTAASALKAAQEAASKGDSDAVIKNSKKAEDLAHLGLKQLSEPPLELKNL